MIDVDKRLDEVQKLFQENNFTSALKKITKLARTNKHNYHVHNYHGIVLVGLGKYHEAILSLQKSIGINPSFAEAFSNMGMAYQHLSNFPKAIHSYMRAIQLDSNALHYRLNLASIYLELDRIHLAIDTLKGLIELNDQVEHAHQLIAEAYIRQTNIDLAIVHHQKALAINPFNALNEFLLGVDFTWAGDLKLAEIHFNKAIGLNPHYCEAFHALGRIKKFSLDDPVVATFQILNNKNHLPSKDRAFVSFAFSKIYDELEIFDQAFEYLIMGNELMRADNPFDHNKLLKLFEEIKRAYNEIEMPKQLATDSQGPCPIFVIGMPRSGSSLIEQIITGSPLIFGGGELTTLHKKFTEVRFNRDDAAKQIVAIKGLYEESLSNLTSKHYVVDKLLLNFYWVGFIKKIFPHCKIIHVKRNPIDICFSIYQNLFVAGSLPFSYNQMDIVNFYHAYEDMMTYWSNLLQDNILHVRYEDLVENPEIETKKLFDYIGIDYKKDYTLIYKNTRPVRTASDVQLRSGINRSAINRWKNYAPYIADIIKSFPNN